MPPEGLPLPQPGQPPDDATDSAAPQPIHIPDESQLEDRAPGATIFEADLVEALKTVHDPEIPINIHDLGLIYALDIAEHDVKVTMTLTTPNCPEAQSIPKKIQDAIKQHVPGVRAVEIDIVWEPRWTKDMMSEDAKLALGMF